MLGTDRGLVKRLRGRDRDAAVELLDRYYPRIYRYLLHLCRRLETAEDLVQETFCTVWTSIDSFRFGSTLSTWIHSIARNHFLQHVRRSGPAEVPLGPALAALPGRSEAGPEEQVSRSEEEERLRRGIENLAPERRDVVELHYLQDLSLRESSGVLGIPVGTVKSRLHAALRDLRRGFAKGESSYEHQEA
ncbi:MAG: RNA polymerase sigma factor [Acidobacteria bacterium]|nr:RNA polymerase sigma factor [Acidobacteriota bacterium]